MTTLVMVKELFSSPPMMPPPPKAAPAAGCRTFAPADKRYAREVVNQADRERLIHTHHAVTVIGWPGSGLPNDRGRGSRADDRHGLVGAKVAYGVSVTTSCAGAVDGQDVSVRRKTDRGVVVGRKIGKLEGATQTTVTARCRTRRGCRQCRRRKDRRFYQR